MSITNRRSGEFKLKIQAISKEYKKTFNNENIKLTRHNSVNIKSAVKPRPYSGKLPPINKVNPKKEILLPILNNDIKKIQDYISNYNQFLFLNSQKINIMFNKNNFYQSKINSIKESISNNNNIEKEINNAKNLNMTNLLNEYDCKSNEDLIKKINEELNLYKLFIGKINDLFLILKIKINCASDSFPEQFNNNIQQDSFFSNIESFLIEYERTERENEDVIKEIKQIQSFDDLITDNFIGEGIFYKYINKIIKLFYKIYQDLFDNYSDLIKKILKENSPQLGKINSMIKSKSGNFTENFLLIRQIIEEIIQKKYINLIETNKLENEKLNIKLSELNDSLKKQKEENDSLNLKINELNEIIKNQKKEIENSKDKISEYSEMINNKREENKDSIDKISEYRVMINNQREENEDSKDKIIEPHKKNKIRNSFLLLTQIEDSGPLSQIIEDPKIEEKKDEEKNEEKENKEEPKLEEKKNEEPNPKNKLEQYIETIKKESLNLIESINQNKKKKEQLLMNTLKMKQNENNELNALNIKNKEKINILEKELNILKNNINENQSLHNILEEFETIKNELLDCISSQEKENLIKTIEHQELIDYLLQENDSSKNIEKMINDRFNHIEDLIKEEMNKKNY